MEFLYFAVFLMALSTVILYPLAIVFGWMLIRQLRRERANRRDLQKLDSIVNELIQIAGGLPSQREN